MVARYYKSRARPLLLPEPGVMVLVGDLRRTQRPELAILSGRELYVCRERMRRQDLSAGGIVSRRWYDPIVRRLVRCRLGHEYRRPAVHVALGVNVRLLLLLLLLLLVLVLVLLLQNCSGRAAEWRVSAGLMLPVDGSGGSCSSRYSPWLSPRRCTGRCALGVCVWRWGTTPATATALMLLLLLNSGGGGCCCCGRCCSHAGRRRRSGGRRDVG